MRFTCSLGVLMLLALSLTIGTLKAQSPGIEFTSVPSWGSHANLQGRVTEVDPLDYRAAILIYVEGLWWNKPSFANPLTEILSDCTWTCDVTTGGIDPYAVRMIAFLVPEGYAVPVGSFDYLPLELFQFPYALTCRLPGTRVIQFAGCSWVVKQCEAQIGPGGNYFTDDPSDVWVDAYGRLHLKIVYRNEKWYCSEVIADTSLGYGQYVFRIESRVDALDPNVIVGLFTWDEWPPQDSAQFYPDYNFREIDIEFSRWGMAAQDTNAQYVVQPWDTEGNIHRFIMSSDSGTTHLFNWQADSITFQSSRGYALPPLPEDIIASWTYTGGDIPAPGRENPRINCWLLNGQPPQNEQDVEVVISNFDDALAVNRAKLLSPPEHFLLYPAHPNPFNPRTTLSFAIPKPGDVSLLVYDLQGREIARLIHHWLPAGEHHAAFDGSRLPSGLYFVRLSADGLEQTRKMLLLK